MADTPNSLAGQVRQILSARGMTLAQVARAAKLHFQESRAHHVRHNLYAALAVEGFRPSLEETFALSVISGLRFADWLRVFGFSLDDVAGLEASLVPLRTTEIDTTIYHPRARVPWLLEIHKPDFGLPLVPLSQWLRRAASQAMDAVSRKAAIRYRYIKIGSEDAFAFPELLPGSVVRVKPALEREAGRAISSRTLFLVEHSRGLVCGRIRRIGKNRLTLCSGQLPYAPIEFEEGKQGTVLGAADLEFRPLGATEPPVVPPSLGRFWNPAPRETGIEVLRLGEWIRSARARSGLSFREASERTRRISAILGRPGYACAASSLSDYETRTDPPRHIQKMISICAVYGVAVSGFLRACGLPLEKGGAFPIPEELMASPVEERPGPAASFFFEEMWNRFGEIPFFLREALPLLFGTSGVSVRDVFWAGGLKDCAHRYLAGCVFLVVDRKRKSPKSSLSSPAWAQPLYVLEEREGRYVCGTCILQNGTLMLRSNPGVYPGVRRLRNGVDAEVVGRVAGVVRQLP